MNRKRSKVILVPEKKKKNNEKRVNILICKKKKSFQFEFNKKRTQKNMKYNRFVNQPVYSPFDDKSTVYRRFSSTAVEREKRKNGRDEKKTKIFASIKHALFD